MLENAAGGEAQVVSRNAAQDTTHQLHASVEQWQYMRVHAIMEFSIGHLHKLVDQ